MDVFDVDILDQMGNPHVQTPDCVRQNDIVIILMFIYCIDLSIRLIRSQTCITFKNFTYYVEQFILRNLKNGNDYDKENED